MSDDGGPRLPTDFNAWMAAEFTDPPKKTPGLRRPRQRDFGRRGDSWRPRPSVTRSRHWRAYAITAAVIAAIVGISLAIPSAHGPSFAGPGPGGPVGPAATAGAAATVGPPPAAEVLFPARVGDASGYQRLGTRTSDHCLRSDVIPAALAARIVSLGGCTGARFALYTDSAHHVLITVGAIGMVDPMTIDRLVPDDASGGVLAMLAPPAGSGLRPAAGAPVYGGANLTGGYLMVGVGQPVASVRLDDATLAGEVHDLVSTIGLGYFVGSHLSASPSA